MRIAIVHYHLKRGGVTRVIESALKALRSAAPGLRIAVFAGEAPGGFSGAHLYRELPGLRYSNAQEKTPSPESLLGELKDAAEETLGGPPDIWHIHNHSLGKNQSMPMLVEHLARSGERLLLQMHDFAEDGRPENHRLNQTSKGTLYPTGTHIHYACLNGRDTACFEAAGLTPETARETPASANTSPVHLLPNPVEAGGPPPEDRPCCAELRDTLGCSELFLYPVRAVRRKNFGELLLWSTCLEPGQALATTLGPTNRDFEAAYQQWQALAAELNLPVHFGIAEGNDWPFETIMASAKAILSTSIAEGFGLAYLEPWLFGKAIIGRDLPAITEDFKTAGVQLNGLYEHLAIPEDWIEPGLLESRLHEQLEATYATYGVSLPHDAVARARVGITPAPGYLDFGGLDEAMQEKVIRRTIDDAEARNWVAGQIPLKHLPESNPIAANRETIHQHYNLQTYGNRLRELYEALAASHASQVGALDPDAVLRQYLKPENFRLLRT